MPLQHINDRMLNRMHRLGNRASIEALVDRIHTRIPGVTFRTAFIVGFPGETDAAFAELRDYVEQTEFDRVAVFHYSDEEGTGAADLDEKVEREVMDERRNALLSIQESISTAKGRAKIGSVLDVLIDERSAETEGVLEGRHEGLAPEIDGVVYIDEGSTSSFHVCDPRPEMPSPKPGDCCTVEITDAAAYDLVGRIVQNSVC
jgi:ribosomal protein S12 methylthiotransferase